MASERIQQILKSVDAKVQKLLKPDRFYVALYDKVKSELSFPWVVHDGENFMWKSRPYDSAQLPDQIIEKKESLSLEKDNIAQMETEGADCWPDEENPASWLGVPILFEARVLGALVVESQMPNAFGERGLRVLTTMARQTASAIENARLYERLNRRIKDLDAVNEIGQKLTSSINLEESEILRLIHEQASKLIHADNMYIALYDDAQDEVRFPLIYVGGEKIEVTARKLDRDQMGKTEYIILERVSLFHATREESKAWYDQPGHADHIDNPLASWIGVPMKVRDKVIGVIAAYHEDQDYVYDKHDLLILKSMASQAAIALDNARFYTQLKALHTISLKVSSVLEIRKVLQSVAHGICELSSSDIATIFPYNANLKEFGEGVRTGDVTEILTRPTNEGFVAELMGKGKSIFKSHEEMADREKIYIDGNIISAYAGIPLMFGEERVGFLFANYYQDHKFSDSEKQLLQLFASQAAGAINNARRYEMADKLAKAERWAELGQLAGSLAHRIGNKGGTIRLRANELNNYLNSKLPNNPIVDDTLQTIIRSNQYLLDLSKVLLKPHRASKKRMAISDITLFLKEALNIAEIPDDVKVKTKLAKNIPYVKSNRFFVEVFLEIITNAISAMKTSEKKELFIQATYDDCWVKVIFKDSGIGITEKDKATIFELFTSHDKEKDSQHFGFGLWWIRTFLRDIGGEVILESKIGIGTTFTIQLPKES